MREENRTGIEGRTGVVNGSRTLTSQMQEEEEKNKGQKRMKGQEQRTTRQGTGEKKEKQH